ncbi:hypothetical protein AGR2A_pa40083 [Agrobacterium genomosp. 2 str. CFBP 5494]|uniref:Uncharacterized protein n=1 Tax=Agrobacterium genomosp. 2 str. CFBP 5494 TaxID=1183436 RepID=A0A9W5B771_9HYPH|nr:hypothetical protein AGR2A_pa40083 [Agrobacterium genomosp. 2 str. CFBP 5494]
MILQIRGSGEQHRHGRQLGRRGKDKQTNGADCAAASLIGKHGLRFRIMVAAMLISDGNTGLGRAGVMSSRLGSGRAEEDGDGNKDHANPQHQR